MITDKFGRQVYTEQDICEIYLSDPDIQLKNVLIAGNVNFNDELELDNLPEIIPYNLDELDLTIEEFDKKCQESWFIPDEYKNFDIVQFVLDQCDSEAELQRAAEELLLYQERDMFMLLKYLKYLVDTMRKNNIVWGVGRGSCVSSFVLYLIGIHKINSLYFDLDISEFLK